MKGKKVLRVSMDLGRYCDTAKKRTGQMKWRAHFNFVCGEGGIRTLGTV